MYLLFPKATIDFIDILHEALFSLKIIKKNKCRLLLLLPALLGLSGIWLTGLIHVYNDHLTEMASLRNLYY